MKTKRTPKLRLAKETLRPLTDNDLHDAAGGTVRNSCVGCIESYFYCSGGCTVTCATQCDTCNRYRCEIYV